MKEEKRKSYDRKRRMNTKEHKGKTNSSSRNRQ